MRGVGGRAPKVLERIIMSKYKAVIFDLDGVICHTDKYHYLGWKAVADELGIYFDEVINNRLRGVSRMESFEIILERYDSVMSEADKIKWAERKNGIYVDLLKELGPADVSGDVLRTLESLKAAGFKLAIGSSSKNAQFILRQIGLIDFFDAVADGTHISNSKPHPEVFLKAAEFIGVEPEFCLVVEDAESGVEAALAAGMDAAAIGDAVHCGKGTYNLTVLSDLLEII